MASFTASVRSVLLRGRANGCSLMTRLSPPCRRQTSVCLRQRVAAVVDKAGKAGGGAVSGLLPVCPTCVFTRGWTSRTPRKASDRPPLSCNDAYEDPHPLALMNTKTAARARRSSSGGLRIHQGKRVEASSLRIRCSYVAREWRRCWEHKWRDAITTCADLTVAKPDRITCVAVRTQPVAYDLTVAKPGWVRTVGLGR